MMLAVKKITTLQIKPCGIATTASAYLQFNLLGLLVGLFLDELDHLSEFAGDL